VPWTAKDASKHKAGLNASQRKKWAAIANGVLKSTGNDAEAIRTANKQSVRTTHPTAKKAKKK
jgi:hypothetical protein